MLSSKYMNNAAMKITNSSEMFGTIYNNGSYLVLFGKRQWQSFKISYELK